MHTDLTGKVAFVAAASQGLGRGVARQLALAGADVGICSRNPEAVTATADALAAESGRRVVPVAADLSTATGAERFVSIAGRELGPADILVVSSGGPRPGSFSDLSDQDWLAAIDLLLLSAVRLTRLVLPGMTERGWGRIVYVTSGAVKTPIPNLGLSNSIRAAVTGLAKTLSAEVGAHGITVNCLAPGRIDTERVRSLDAHTAAQTGQSTEVVKAGMVRQIPAGRYGHPDEFGLAALFLCSPAAAYISGVTLMVDGGGTNTLF